MRRYQTSAVFLVSALLIGSLGFSSRVLADAWWGKGYRTPTWVLSHGGTIINYKINGNASSDRYKAVMYQNGKYVEVEFGKSATFDDAKNGVYTVTFYKGGASNTESYKGGKALASVDVRATAGKKIFLTFEEKTKNIAISSNFPYKKVVKEVDLTGQMTKLNPQTKENELSLLEVKPYLKPILSIDEYKLILSHNIKT